jgi:hypothetical protein
LDGKPPGIGRMLPNRTCSQHYLGQPVIEIQSSGFGHQPILMSAPAPVDTDATSFVASWMILAGGAAANWAWERKIPLIYRASMAKAPLEEIINHRCENEQYFNNLPEGVLKDIARQTEFIKQGKTVILPRPGLLLSQMIPRYSKVTSPLRRFGDMINHFQIESALRYEADTGRSLVTEGSEPRSELAKVLTFSQQEIESEILRLTEREDMILQAQAGSKKFWLVEFLRRAKDHNECAIPKTFKLRMPQVHPGRKWHWAEMPFLHAHISARIDRFQPEFAAHDGIKPLDVWEAELDEIDTSRERINLKRARLLDRVEEEDSWKHWRNYNKLLDSSPLPPIWT